MKKLITILAVSICISMALPAFAQSEFPEVNIVDGVLQYPMYPVDEGVVLLPEDGVWAGIPQADITEGAADPGEFDYARFYDVYRQWEEHGYPDDIGGVYYEVETEKQLVFVINPTPERREELYSLLGEDAIIIVPCIYSYSELTRVRDEIRNMFELGKVYTADIAQGYAYGHEFGESGKELRVLVGVAESELAHYRTLFAEQYGGMVIVGIGGPGVLYSLDGGILGGYIGTPGSNNNNYLWIVLAILAIGLLGTFAIIQRQRTQRMSAMQTTIGDVVTASPPVTRKETIAAVKNSAVKPDDKVFKSIMEKADSKP
jgi:hypothetical protein